MTPDEMLEWARNNPGNAKSKIILEKLSKKSAPEEMAKIGQNQTTANVDELKRKPLEIVSQALSFPLFSKNSQTLMGQAAKLGNILKQQEKESDSDEELGPEATLGERADVRQYINQLVTAKQSENILSQVEKAKQGVNTGPWAGGLFDSSIPRYDPQGVLEEPGLFDKLITTIASGPTSKMRKLEAAIQSMGKPAQQEGGKNLTKLEKEFYFSKVPNRFDDDEVFQEIISLGKSDLSDYMRQRIKLLNDLGFDQAAIEQLVKNPPEQGQAVSAPSKAKFKMVNGQLQKVE